MGGPLIAAARRALPYRPDLPGIGGSDIPKDGLAMKGAALRIHDLVQGWGLRAVSRWPRHRVDGGLAYACAVPAETEKLVLMDAVLPGVAGWEKRFTTSPRSGTFDLPGRPGGAVAWAASGIYSSIS